MQTGSVNVRQTDFSPIRACLKAALSLAPGVLTILSGCAEGSDLPTLPEKKSSAYHLGPGDQLRVITFGEQQLTGDFKVSDGGTVALPLVGVVPAAGKTPAQLGDDIANELRDKNLLRDPSVSVEVTNYRPIFVLGEVAKPGQYPYQPGMTTLTAVTVAGGFTYRAITDYASIVRVTNGHPVEGRVSRQSYVEPGDVVTIFERHF
jgi:polysaccharide biosynthesis/export protein